MSAVSSRQHHRLHVCMLAYSFVESDTRILQYATALAKRGDEVDVIALGRGHDFPEHEMFNGINVYRIQSRTVNEKGILAYAWRLLCFFVRSALFLRRRHRAYAYDLVHVHNVPDCLIFAAIVPRWKGVPVILDVHDLLPEFYASKFKISHDSYIFKSLMFIEKCSAAFSSRVIVANHLWRDRFIGRSSSADKCDVIRNYPDLDIFAARPMDEPRDHNKLVLTYPGSLNWHQGVDIAIHAFSLVADEMPEAEFHIYGEGPAKSTLVALTDQLGMRSRIIFHEFLPSHEIARVMASSDIAIEPKRATSLFGNEALSTKILEFMALGVPVIASKTRIHAHYYDDSILMYYDNDDPTQLGEALLLLRNHPMLRWELASRASEYASKNNWQRCKDEYLAIVDSLVSGKSGKQISLYPASEPVL